MPPHAEPTADEATRAKLAAYLAASLHDACAAAAAPPSPPAVTERSILFATPMVRALLDGRKTQTRRLVTPQPIPGESPARRCPFGHAGDVLWVREKWGYAARFRDGPRSAADAPGPFVYAADGLPAGARCQPWKPSLHMPRAASRLRLRVTATRAERLQAIGPADARAEGCPPMLVENPVDWFAHYWDQFNDARPGAGWTANPWVWVVNFEVVR